MISRAPAFVLALAIAAPFVALADIRITEIMYDPSGADSKREWVEIYNAGSDTVDISKYKFTDKSNHVLNAPPKNGGSGSLMMSPGTYLVLASDATTFLSEYSGRSVIDTAMSLNNTGASISLTSGTSVIDSVAYAKSQGAAGNGDSLQMNGSVWIHAKPTPGAQNATNPSATAAKKTTVKSASVSKEKTPTKKIIAVATAEAAENDPLAIVNAKATSGEMQTAAAGSLGSSMWWFAAAALAIGAAAAASLISNGKKKEWDIEESE